MTVHEACIPGSWNTLGSLTVSLHRTTRVPDHEDPSRQTVTNPPSVSLPFSPPCTLTPRQTDGGTEYLAVLDCNPDSFLQFTDAVALRLGCPGVRGAAKVTVKAEGVNVVVPRDGDKQQQQGALQDYFVLKHRDDDLWVRGVAVQESPQRLVRQFVTRNGDGGASIQSQATGSFTPEDMGVFEIKAIFAQQRDNNPRPPRPPITPDLSGPRFSVGIRVIDNQLPLELKGEDEEDGEVERSLRIKDFTLSDVYETDTVLHLMYQVYDHICLLMSRLVEFGNENDPRQPETIIRCGPDPHGQTLIHSTRCIWFDQTLKECGIKADSQVYLLHRLSGGAGGLLEEDMWFRDVKVVPGGLIAEPPLEKDPGCYDWKYQQRGKVKIRIVNPEQFRNLVSADPPTPPALPNNVSHVRDSWTERQTVDLPEDSYLSNAHFALSDNNGGGGGGRSGAGSENGEPRRQTDEYRLVAGGRQTDELDPRQVPSDSTLTRVFGDIRHKARRLVWWKQTGTVE